MTKQFNVTHLLIFLALAFASFVSTVMVLARLEYSGRFSYFFLIWNLFLAWMPYWLALAAWHLREKPVYALTFGGMWLLFFPNAPYLITDFIHLYPKHGVPVWYDGLMIFSFALTGLALGLVSLYIMQSVVTRWLGVRLSWLFVAGALLLSGFGVYVGRFLRWNSWDLFSNPLLLMQDMAQNFLDPTLFLRTAVVTLSLTAVMGFMYGMAHLLPRLEMKRENVMRDA